MAPFSTSLVPDKSHAYWRNHLYSPVTAGNSCSADGAMHAECPSPAGAMSYTETEGPCMSEHTLGRVRPCHYCPSGCFALMCLHHHLSPAWGKMPVALVGFGYQSFLQCKAADLGMSSTKIHASGGKSTTTSPLVEDTSHWTWDEEGSLRIPKDMEALCIAELRAREVLHCSKWQYRLVCSRCFFTDLVVSLPKKLAFV